MTAPTIITGSFPLPPPPPGRRFFEGYPWRFLFADIPSYFSIGGVTTTWANGLVTNRQISISLNAPSTISGAIWPDNRNVNAIFPTDGDPLVAQGNRIVYAFRREGTVTPEGTEEVGPWVCRAAGILMSPEDQGDPDVPLTHFAAYDPWQYLQARPAVNAAGELPLASGLIVPATPGSTIATDYLRSTIDADGFCFIDAGKTNGGTDFYGGTIETTDQISLEVQRGMSVADVWSSLCDSGNLDIVLSPIYDTRRPGYTHELNIYKLAGSERPKAIFGWDRMNRSVGTIDRMHDGTPGNFVNTIQAYAGQGGFPVPASGPLTNNASIEKYLPYWLNQFNVTQGASDPTGSVILAMAQLQLMLQKQGLRTTTLTPTPERAPIPLVDYGIGDRVQVYASNRLRVTSTGYQRVQAIPITITDDGIEQVPALLCSPDWDTTREGT